MRKTQVINGIEGDDIPYHLSILGYDIQSNKNTYFISLNDHYGLHNEIWLETTIKTAQNYNKIVFYDLINTGDEYHDNFCKFIEEFPHQNKWYLTNNFNKNFSLNNVKLLAWDFMWNRTKLYYTDIDEQKVRAENFVLHHYAGKSKYLLNELGCEHKRDKIFLNLCGRAYGYRLDLYEFLKSDKGYQSLRSQNIILDDDNTVGAYNPIPNYFYDNSFISVYVESNCTSNQLIHITEKTFEPLIKGHFILPFANIGTVERLRDLGFCFPDFIDYSYDSILDVRQRFAAFKKVVINTLSLPFPDLYKANFDLILHNRNQLYKLDYDRSILKIFDE